MTLPPREKFSLLGSLSDGSNTPHIPLPFAAFPSHDPVKIDSGVTIRRLHRLEHLARARGNSWGSVTLPAINAATHAIVMEGFEIDNTDPWRRRLGWLNGNAHYDLG